MANASAGPRLAVLLSGGGTTLQNFLDRIADGRLRAQLVQVVSNQPEAYGLERARRARLPARARPPVQAALRAPAVPAEPCAC
ncbi:MAG TPA: formyltransferase family protein [Rhodanobacteraceae bacterium]|nr:formyltransferase family protein [Rhodanobacteraceae bacterium]